MKIQAVHFKNPKGLFQFIDKILGKNALYTIYYNRVDGYCYTVEYLISDEQDDMYQVIRGKGRKGFKFFIRTDINEERMSYLRKGDILLFEREYGDKVWFACPTMLAKDSGYTHGMTTYGGIKAMLKEGLIQKAISGR